jgi:hypothetical protein
LCRVEEVLPFKEVLRMRPFEVIQVIFMAVGFVISLLMLVVAIAVAI